VLSIPLNQPPRRRRQQRKSQIRTVAGFAEMLKEMKTSGAAACNHPNCLVLPFRLELIRFVGGAPDQGSLPKPVNKSAFIKT
jgi:hypothetical protein